MKKTFVSVIVILAVTLLASCSKKDSLTATAPEAITVVAQSTVPAAVIAAFTSNFSGATEVEWHKSGSSFEVEFNHQSQRHSVGFDDSGHQNKHNITCTGVTVPAAVLNAFRTRNPNDNVYEWKLTSDGNWKAHFMRNGVKWETTFTPAGVFVKEEHE